ncbi:discoidin domain-containing protein [Streptomyces sp. H27-C3]|uniref:discoidin domain-containing protein n=1 Tax=Streptomyces sp. H27-C3 TaxID=3046305 RepID=UPI0032D95684
MSVDLGASQAVGRVVLKLPPAAAWAARTQTLTVLGSPDGSAFRTIVAAKGYRFDPATGNTVSITLPVGIQIRHLRLTGTANTGWPAVQLSEVEAYRS